MSIGIGLLVFFVSLIALVAEFILYFILGMGAAFTTNSASAIGGLAFFFVGLMIFTGAVGILFPVCAILAAITKNKKLGNTVFLSLLTFVLIGYFWFASVAMKGSTHAAIPAIAATRPLIGPAVNPIAGQQSVDKPINPQSSQPAKSPEMEYIEKSLILKNVKVGNGYGEFDMPGYSETKKGVFGTIKNTGDQSVGQLQITIYFLDSKKLRIGEKTYTVISTSSMFDATPPLKPNYSKDFGYVVEKDAPSDWASEVEVEISKIAFEKEA